MMIFVTGARGAIGQHVVSHAVSRGHRVAGIGHGQWLDSAGMPPLRAWVNGSVDIANLSALTRACGLPDAIVHLAGGSLVGASLAQPLEDFRRTVDSVQSMLDWARTHAPQVKVVLASSAAVYGGLHSVPIPEHAPIQPVSPYGTHKAMAELSAQMYAQNFDLQIAVVRLFSVYGPGLRKQFVWDLMTKLIAGSGRVELGGTGSETRDFLYIADAADLLLDAIDVASSPARVVNGCSGAATTIRKLSDVVLTHFPKGQVSFSGVSRPGDPDYLAGDNTFAKRLGLTSKVRLEEGIVETAGWIRATVVPGSKVV